MGKLAEAYVDIRARDSQLPGDLGAAGAKIDGWSRSAGASFGGLASVAAGIAGPLSIAAALAAAYAASAAKAAEFFAGCASKAADLAEATNKVEVAFGPSAAIVKRFADDAAAAFGLVKKDVLDATAGIGLMVQGMGMGQEESAKLSTRLALLAADAMSLHNMPLNVVLEKIRAGLSGESEPLRILGVNLLETEVKANAVARGFAKVGEELSNEAKMASRADLIMKGLAAANGDLANTSESLSNKQRRLAGDWENMQTQIGEAFIGPMGDAISLVYDLGASFEKLTGGASAFQVLGDAMTGVVDQLRLLASEGDASTGVLIGLMTYISKATGGAVIPQSAIDNLVEEREHRLVALDAAQQKRRTARRPQAEFEPGKELGDGAPSEKALEKVAKDREKRLRAFIDGAMDDRERFEAKIWEANNLYATGEIDNNLREKSIAKAAGIDDQVERARDKVFDLENARRPDEAGRVLGDIYGAHNALQNQALQNDPQREQLETAKRTLDKLEEIREALMDNDPGAYDRLKLVLKGRE